VRNGILLCKYRDATLTGLLSHKASPQAISAEAAHFYQGYLGEYDPGTCYGWNTNSEKLDSESCG
jgi:hypothetical protein